MPEVLIFQAQLERFGGERTYGWLLGTDYTFEVAPVSHPDSNFIADDDQVGYAQVGPGLVATLSRYLAPGTTQTSRLALTTGDGFAYQLVDDTGEAFYTPTRFSSFADGAVFIAASPRADTAIAGGQALMFTDGVSAPRLLIDEPVSAYWNLGDELWALEGWGPATPTFPAVPKDLDLYRIDPDLNVVKTYDWVGEEDDIETIEVFETAGGVFQFAWTNNEQEFFRHDAETGWTDLDIVVYRTDFAGTASNLFFYWDDRRPNDVDIGIELWASDGSPNPFLVRDLFPGEGDAYPGEDLARLTASAGDRFFTYALAEGEIDGAELWVTDGTPGGTVQLTGSALPAGSLEGFDSFWDVHPFDEERILFVAGNAATGTELYVSDGTPEGTGQIVDLLPGEEGSLPVILATSEGVAFFSISSGPDDDRIWVTDGTSEGTFALRDLRPSGGGVRPAMAEVVQFDLNALPLRPFEGTELPDELTGSDLRDVLSGFEGDDLLQGLGGADLLDGGPGQDTMEGGPGDDTYILDNFGDRVREVAGEGIDRIEATADVILRGAEVEVIALLGDESINAYGSPDTNEIVGNGRGNVLAGFGGSDVLTGGGGGDAFAFRSGDIGGPVLITDFGDGADRLALDDRFFGLGTGRVDPRPVAPAEALVALAAGQVAYDRSTGTLSIDADGSEGPGGVVEIAILEGGPGIGIGDVLLF